MKPSRHVLRASPPPAPRARRRPARRALAALLLGSLLAGPAFAAADASPDATEGTAAVAAPDTADAPGTESASPPATPAFPATADGAIDLAPHAGKVVYVDFWASWCTPCRAAFPWMNALQAELADDLVVIGVNTGDTPAEAARFLERVPAAFTLMEDDDGAIARAYGVVGMPTAFVHGRDGTLLDSHQGFDESLADERAAALRELVRRTR